MDIKLRVHKIRPQTETVLTADLLKLQEELSQLRVAKIAGGTANKLGKIKVKK